MKLLLCVLGAWAQTVQTDAFTCPSGHLSRSSDVTQEDYLTVYSEIKELYQGIGNRRGQAEFTGCILRLAAHDFLDYIPTEDFGGPDGCMDSGIEANSGLQDCLGSLPKEDITQVYTRHCDRVNIPDFIVIAAEAAISITAPCEVTFLKSFLTNFKWGRKWCGISGVAAVERQKEFKLLRDNFKTPDSDSQDAGRKLISQKLTYGLFHNFNQPHERYLNNEEGVGNCRFQGNGAPSGGVQVRDVLSAALLGAHTLGRATIENSNNIGWWSDVENSGIFNNNYYVSLITKGWTVVPGRNGMWKRTDRGKTDVPEMMLNADLTLLWTLSPVECCIFSAPGTGFNTCGSHANCCEDKETCPRKFSNTSGVLHEFARNQNVFFDYFSKAWYIATTVNQPNLKNINLALGGVKESEGSRAECYSWGCEFFENAEYFNANKGMIPTGTTGRAEEECASGLLSDFSDLLAFRNTDCKSSAGTFSAPSGDSAPTVRVSSAATGPCGNVWEDEDDARCKEGCVGKESLCACTRLRCPKDKPYCNRCNCSCKPTIVDGEAAKTYNESATIAQECHFKRETGYDFYGNDLHRQAIRHKNLDECEKECNKNPKCKFYTHRKGFIAELDECWLKHSAGEKKTQPASVTTASKLCGSIPLRGEENAKAYDSKASYSETSEKEESADYEISS